MKVAVIVDDLDPSRRRRCFWEEQLSNLPGVQIELVSLLAKMDERKFFDVYAYDVIIFNWCVLDGALMYASDRVQDIVAFNDDHFNQFVRKGGIIIVEDQPKRWRPEQKAYGVLLNDEVKVVSRDNYFFGTKVRVNERLRKHPMLQNLPPVLQSAYAHPTDESWFPEGSTSLKSIQELNPMKVYSGGFRSWQSDWLPLLYSEDGMYPVMLVKTDGLGVWIVTTMFLASSNIRDLIEAAVLGCRRHISEIQRFHARQKYVRQVALGRVVGIFVVIAVGIYALLATHVVIANVPYGGTVIGNVVLSVVLAIGASALTILRKFIWRNLKAALNR